VSCQSAYLGDGWFQYDVTIHNDPFFQAVEMPNLHIHSFTNFLAYGPIPTNWSITNLLNSIGWAYTNSSALPLPYNVTFLAQSTNTTYKEGELQFLMVVYPQDQYISPLMTVSWGIVTTISGLIPCAPEEVDESPPSLYASEGITPDIHIDDFLVISNRIFGLSFSWEYESTMIISACDDLKSWTNISYALGNPGQTTWTSSVPLDVYGRYFRIKLFATEQRSELIE